MTKVYLAGEGFQFLFKENCSRVNRMKSYFYVTKKDEDASLPYKDFMLDSGAFTFKKNSKEKSVDWMEYCEGFAEYIVKNKVEKWFELDIDAVIGYPKVKELRKYLETATNAQSIPVWHMNRGKEEWLRMCDEYDYVAIGGIASDSRKIDPYLPWFTKEAHKRNAKVHGLGYTRLANLARVRFDSVDSTAWLYGNLGGYVYGWDGSEMQKANAGEGQKLKTKEAARHNFMEWVKLAEDLERGLA